MKILFVCTGNTCRSPMAKYLFEKLIRDNNRHDIEVLSAGTSVYCPTPISRHAGTLLREKNIDASSHLSMQFSPEIADSDTLILTMGRSHKEIILINYPELVKQTYVLSEYVGETKDVVDPFGGSLEIYRSCLAELDRLTQKLYLQI